jgi:predicted transcriptional regulator
MSYNETDMAVLSQEQRDLLILIGSPDDGSQTHVVMDGERITKELMELGLVYQRAKNHYDFTDKGERLYGELTGMDVG